MYLPGVCWSWLGCYSLWFPYLTRSVIELYNFLCNGQNDPDHWEMIIISYVILYQYYVLGRMYVLANGMLVLVGFCQPLVPVFDHNFTLELQKLLCNAGPNFPDHRAIDIIH
jgi:hypothetical protein